MENHESLDLDKQQARYQRDDSERIFSDGERQAPIDLKEVEPTHLIRYQFALDYITPGDMVLDAPRGSDYGTKLFASIGAKVERVDIHEGAIKHAKRFFSDENNSFFVGDMENLKRIFPENNCFDVVVSFEGVEHLKNPEAFLNEISRLLKKEGKFIVSTPPRKPHGSPYYTKEYSLEEFKELLSVRFDVKQIFAQIYTDIFDLTKRQVNPDDYKKFNFIAYCALKKGSGKI